MTERTDGDELRLWRLVERFAITLKPCIKRGRWAALVYLDDGRMVGTRQQPSALDAIATVVEKMRDAGAPTE